MTVIWGDKTEAWFDIWSLEHFIAGMTMASIVLILFPKFAGTELNEKTRIKFFSVIILLIAYMWEVAEFYMEAGYTNIEAVTYWFQGVEFWGNRFVTDPWLVLVGALIAYHHSFLKWPSRVFSFSWLFVHVFIFPHCMYIHEYFGWE